jgi:6-phosphogluconolactonase
MGGEMARGSGDRGTGAVYVQTNQHGHNGLMAFDRDAAGGLTSPVAVPTGGSGDGVAHLTSQGSVMLTGDGRHVLVANAGSGDVSMFAVEADGPHMTQTVATGGAPKSVTEHDGLVYVLNTDPPSLTGFRLSDQAIEPIDDSTRMLAADADPAQVGLSPDGTSLLVTERGSNDIASYAVNADGSLADRHVQPSSGPTPYGFAFAGGGALVVTEAFGAQKGKAAASSYVMRDDDIEPASRSIGNGRSEVCWAVVSNDGRYAFTTNFADSGVSRYAIGADGSLTLDDPAAGTAVDGHAGLRDETLSDDGRFLYAIDADSQRIFGWTVGSGGSLSPIGSWGGLPDTVAGLAAS